MDTNNVNTITIFGHTFEHLSIIRPIGDPIRLYMVRTDEGYWIHTPRMLGENVYKTATSIYSDDDFDNIVVIHESKLPTEEEQPEVEATETELKAKAYDIIMGVSK